LRLRLFALCVLSLTVSIGALAVGPSSAAVCSGDVCVISTPFDGLRTDIAANAPARLVRLFTAEANLSQAWHPPGPCTPGSCVASQLVLIALDLQVRGLPVEGCPGGCGFTATNVYVLDHDIRGILADPAIYTVGLQLIPPGPPCIPPGPPGIPGPS
jgi:hypothetical protein